MSPISYATYAVPRADLGEAVLEFDDTLEGFIAGQILPERPVARKSATLSVKTRENMKRVDTEHSNGGVFNRTGIALEDLEYVCKDYGLEAPLSDDDRGNFAEDFNAELETTDDITLDILREYEIRTKDLIFNTTTFTGVPLYKDYSGTPWATAATDIVLQINWAINKIRLNAGGIANALIIGDEALTQLLNNDDIIARFPGAPVVTRKMIETNLSAIFGLERLIVGKQIYDSADPGQDFTGADIWEDTYATVARISDSGSSLRRGGLGRTIVWDKMTDAFNRVVQYREEQSESDIFRVRQYQIEKLLNVYSGFLLKINT